MKKPIPNTLTQSDFDTLKQAAQQSLRSLSTRSGGFGGTTLTPFYDERLAVLTAYVGYRLGFDGQTEATVSAAKDALKGKCGSKAFSELVRDTLGIADRSITARLGTGVG